MKTQFFDEFKIRDVAVSMRQAALLQVIDYFRVVIDYQVGTTESLEGFDELLAAFDIADKQQFRLFADSLLQFDILALKDNEQVSEERVKPVGVDDHIRGESDCNQGDEGNQPEHFFV